MKKIELPRIESQTKHTSAANSGLLRMVGLTTVIIITSLSIGCTAVAQGAQREGNGLATDVAKRTQPIETKAAHIIQTQQASAATGVAEVAKLSQGQPTFTPTVDSSPTRIITPTPTPPCLIKDFASPKEVGQNWQEFALEALMIKRPIETSAMRLSTYNNNMTVAIVNELCQKGVRLGEWQAIPHLQSTNPKNETIVNYLKMIAPNDKGYLDYANNRTNKDGEPVFIFTNGERNYAIAYNQQADQYRLVENYSKETLLSSLLRPTPQPNTLPKNNPNMVVIASTDGALMLKYQIGTGWLMAIPQK